MGWWVVVCMGAMLAGVYASFHIDSAPAPTVVLILTVFRYAQGKMLRDFAPVYREPPSE